VQHAGRVDRPGVSGSRRPTGGDVDDAKDDARPPTAGPLR